MAFVSGVSCVKSEEFVGASRVRCDVSAVQQVACLKSAGRHRSSLYMSIIGQDLSFEFDEIVPANSEFAKKYSSKRNASVRPVGESVKAFFKLFARPLPTVYSTLINETLTTTHLSVVNYAFNYDAIFAYGFEESFNRFLQYYPSESEKERLFECLLKALELDVGKIRKDAASVRQWVEGKTIEDLFAVADGSADDGSSVASAFRTARENDRMSFHISRMFALGCVYLLEAVKADAEGEDCEKLAAVLDVSAFGIKDAMDQNRAGMEKLKAAEQLFAEVAARDKRKNAERLAEKAKLAKEAAEKAEAEAESEAEVVSSAKTE
uniref:Uncharacterized protein n=1 Tax=Timspurckia oligopyrenoides TaxID=708627 RepID=A0A7S0ZHJ1_9RHOD|mmetsp:Transcript_5508/g.9701  ORF Transcript_5508/g.9701 Transcript_5508/m.9701 type:complete len:322 (+) Transcript_5508:118-1083(+)